MIISNEYRFVFVQVPQTASSFLGHVFQQQFGGEPILAKHATYDQFLKMATPEQASYRSVIGKRHPLDMVTTHYARRINRAGVKHTSIEETQADFELWFRWRFLTKARKRLTPHIMHSYPFVDHVIRQENLVEDLNAVLKELGLEAPAATPLQKTRTERKLDRYTQYYAASLIPHALEKFKYEMNMLGYEAPEIWRV